MDGDFECGGEPWNKVCLIGVIKGFISRAADDVSKHRVELTLELAYAECLQLWVG